VEQEEEILVGDQMEEPVVLEEHLGNLEILEEVEEIRGEDMEVQQEQQFSKMLQQISLQQI
jgi:hypothetical protein